MDSIIVFSHLRWDFVYQRPQHLLSRLAKHYRILFFEEPVLQEGQPSLSLSTPIPNLTVCRPCTPVDKPAFHEEQIPFLQRMLSDVSGDYPEPIVWFYTPMAMPLLEELEPQCVVYDCMDELSAFKNPPVELLEGEDALLKRADIVFAGGPSLYAAKKLRHPNVHCFPSSVDVNHFRQARDRNIIHPALEELSRPRLGFYGVIDERLDTNLVAHIADAHPEWQIVLVGPVAKIDPEAVPRRPNIHRMGQQPYAELPRFLAAWDVCLMPFAINESTRFISPTKSLEYMAAELPIVSTPIKDVVDLHGDVVEIADTAQAFIAACERVLNMPSEDMRKKIRLMRDRLSKTSWNATAQGMQKLLEQFTSEREQQMGSST